MNKEEMIIDLYRKLDKIVDNQMEIAKKQNTIVVRVNKHEKRINKLDLDDCEKTYRRAI